MTFYEKLCELCEERGIYVTNIGQFIMVNGNPIGKSSVTAWKNGAKPRPVTLVAIADYFKVPVSYLKDDDETEQASHGDCSHCACADNCKCHLSPQEHQLIRMFRDASELDKIKMVSKVLEVWEHREKE